MCLFGMEGFARVFAYHAGIPVGRGVMYVVPARDPAIRIQRQLEASRTSVLNSVLPWPKCCWLGEGLRRKAKSRIPMGNVAKKKT